MVQRVLFLPLQLTSLFFLQVPPIPPCLTSRKHELLIILKPSLFPTMISQPTLRNGQPRSPTPVPCTSCPSLHASPRLPRLSGLFSFASTTFILSMYNVNARH